MYRLMLERMLLSLSFSMILMFSSNLWTTVGKLELLAPLFLALCQSITTRVSFAWLVFAKLRYAALRTLKQPYRVISSHAFIIFSDRYLWVWACVVNSSNLYMLNLRHINTYTQSHRWIYGFSYTHYLLVVKTLCIWFLYTLSMYKISLFPPKISFNSLGYVSYSSSQTRVFVSSQMLNLVVNIMSSSVTRY